MIYEKRENGFPVKTEDLPVKEKGFAGWGGIMPKKAETCPPRTRRRRRFVRYGKRRRYRCLCKWLAAATMIFCIATADARLLDGRLALYLGGAVQNGARITLETLSETPDDNSSTLYSRLVTDAAEQVEALPQAEALEEQEKPPSETALAVAGSVSQSYVDGTRFYPITSLDLSADSIYSLSNGTSFSPDMKKLGETTPKALQNVAESDGPLVLIVHTHAEECYTEHTDMYPDGESTRSPDTEKNVVRVGEEIADTLSLFGIQTLHCRKMHDSESFINAYSGSAESVKEYLEEYPSVKIVVDVHRDAIIREDGESIKAVTDIAGQDYAQIMFVVGTNELGHEHPFWQDNLSLAIALQKNIDLTYPSLCRSINLRNVPFNQQLSSGYLLLEVGTSANTLDEALRSARAFGENLARTLYAARG